MIEKFEIAFSNILVNDSSQPLMNSPEYRVPIQSTLHVMEKIKTEDTVGNLAIEEDCADIRSEVIYIGTVHVHQT